MSNTEVGNRPKALRTTLGYSQPAFSDSLAVSLRALQNYEQGERKAPAELLIALVRKFNVGPVWVIDGPELEPQMRSSLPSIDGKQLAYASTLVALAIPDDLALGINRGAKRYLVALEYNHLTLGGNDQVLRKQIAGILRGMHCPAT